MNYVARMEEVKASSNTKQLGAGVSMRVSMGYNTTRGTPTRSSRSTLGYSSMYPVRFPPGIQSEISWRGVEVTPRKGTIF